MSNAQKELSPKVREHSRKKRSTLKAFIGTVSLIGALTVAGCASNIYPQLPYEMRRELTQQSGTEISRINYLSERAQDERTDPEVRGTIISILREEAREHPEAIRALGQIGRSRPEAREMIIGMLYDIWRNNPEQRREYPRGEIDDLIPEGLPTDEQLEAVAERINGAVRDILAWRRDGRGRRDVAIYELGTLLGEDEYQERITNVLELALADEDANVRFMATRGLYRFATQETTDARTSIDILRNLLLAMKGEPDVVADYVPMGWTGAHHMEQQIVFQLYEIAIENPRLRGEIIGIYEQGLRRGDRHYYAEFEDVLYFVFEYEGPGAIEAEESERSPGEYLDGWFRELSEMQRRIMELFDSIGTLDGDSHYEAIGLARMALLPDIDPALANRCARILANQIEAVGDLRTNNNLMGAADLFIESNRISPESRGLIIRASIGEMRRMAAEDNWEGPLLPDSIYEMVESGEYSNMREIADDCFRMLDSDNGHVREVGAVHLDMVALNPHAEGELRNHIAGRLLDMAEQSDAALNAIYDVLEMIFRDGCCENPITDSIESSLVERFQALDPKRASSSTVQP